MVDRKLLSLFFSTVLFCLVLGVIAPFLPLLAHNRGLEEWKMGLVFSSMPLASLVASPCIGTWMHKVGRRWTLTLAFSMAVRGRQCVSMLVVGSSIWSGPDAFFVLNLAARVLTGVAAAFLFTVSTCYPVNTIIASDYPTQVFSLIGINESCAGLGVMGGPLVGTLLYELFGFAGVFFGLAGVFAVTGAAVYAVLGADRGYVYAKLESGILSLMLKPAIAATLLPLAFSMVTAGANSLFMSPHFSDYGLSTTWIGLLFGLYGMGFLLCSLVVSHTLHDANKRMANSTGCLIGVVGMSLMGPWPEVLPNSLVVIIIGFVLVPISLALLFVEALPSLIEVATIDLGLESDDKLLDKLSGLLNMGASIGEIIGPLLASLLIPKIGVPQTCAVISAVGLVVIAVYAMVMCGLTRRTQQPLVTPFAVPS